MIWVEQQQLIQRQKDTMEFRKKSLNSLFAYILTKGETRSQSLHLDAFTEIAFKNNCLVELWIWQLFFFS